MDRVARSVKEGIEIIDQMIEKGASIEILNMGKIDNSPGGNLMRNTFLAFAEFERDMIVQRTQEGKRIARQNPCFKDGRPKKFSPQQRSHALELLKNHSYKEVAEMTGISKATLIRI